MKSTLSQLMTEYLTTSVLWAVLQYYTHDRLLGRIRANFFIIIKLTTNILKYGES